MTMRQYGVIVAATAVPAIVLSGCGAKSKPDTPYRGSYRAAYTIPDLNESGTFSFTVEQKGGMTGAFVDNNSGKTYAFSGGVASSGYFSGTLQNGADKFSVTGTLAIASTTSGGGDFQQSRGSQTYRGSFSLTDAGITPTPGSSFRGAYSGSYNIPGLSQTGTLSFSVDTRGVVTGSWTRDNQTGYLNGSVKETGTLSGTITFDNETVTLGGTLNPTKDGTTSGNFQLTQAGKTYPGSFGTSQTAPAGDSPFLGAYRGTYSVPEQQESGNISFTVDPRGKITGFFSQSSNLPVGTFTAAVNNDGTFAGSVTYDPSTNIATRPITGKIANSTVNGKKAGDFVWTINGKNAPGNFEVGVGASEPDSQYRGSYVGPSISNAIRVLNPPPQLAVTDTRLAANSIVLNEFGVPTSYFGSVTAGSFTIDKQGTLVGNLGGFNLKINVTNDGRVFGTIGGFPVRGTVSHQQIEELDTSDVLPVTDKDGKIVGYKIKYTYKFLPGIAGDLIITVNGKEYNASIQLIGGNTTG